MYKCQQCKKDAEVRGQQDIDINYDTPFISEWVICQTCNYTIPKDTADKAILLDACEKMISSFKKSSSVPISLNSAYETMKQAITKAKQ